MTPSAGLEIQIAAERSAPVVASRARVVARRKVLLRARRTDLPSLRQTCRVVVTARTFQPLTRAVFSMTETHAIGRRICGRAGIRLGCVTDAARCQVPPI